MTYKFRSETSKFGIGQKERKMEKLKLLSWTTSTYRFRCHGEELRIKNSRHISRNNFVSLKLFNFPICSA
jgi:hypothetical protein